MPFIPAVNTAQVKINQRMHGQLVQNVIYVQNASPWGPGDLTALCNLVITWWNGSLADGIHGDLKLETVSARDMTVEEGPGVEIAAPALSGGNLTTGGALPGNVALCVKFITGLTGPNRRGRNFVSGMAEERVNGNDITDFGRDDIVDAYGALRDALNAAVYTHVVASFYNGTALVLQPNGETRKRPIARATALLTPIEQYTANAQLDSQRKRLSGRGL